MSEQQNNGQRNNNNRNNNRNRNNNNRNNNGNRNNNNRKPRQNKPKPLVLSTWQKVLIFCKITSEDKIRKQLQANRPPRKKTPGQDESANTKTKNKSNTTTAKSNTRPQKERRAPQKVEVESARLYVGNLSYDATEYDIEDLFKGIGSVKKVEIIYNKHTHKSKGYGFVQMLNVDEAKRAVDVLHDQPFLGRNLIVNGSKARKESDPNSDSFEEPMVNTEEDHTLSEDTAAQD